MSAFRTHTYQFVIELSAEDLAKHGAIPCSKFKCEEDDWADYLIDAQNEIVDRRILKANVKVIDFTGSRTGKVVYCSEWELADIVAEAVENAAWEAEQAALEDQT